MPGLPRPLGVIAASASASGPKKSAGRVDIDAKGTSQRAAVDVSYHIFISFHTISYFIFHFILHTCETVPKESFLDPRLPTITATTTITSLVCWFADCWTEQNLV